MCRVHDLSMFVCLFVYIAKYTDVLDENEIEWIKRGHVIKWRMSYEQARNAFEYGTSLDKEDGHGIFYKEELRFIINLKSRTLRIKGVILKRNIETGIIEGNDLLND